MVQYTYREFVRILNRNGYEYDRSSGSHNIYKKGGESVAVPTRLNPCIARRLIREKGLR